jgi:hypothetical protein
MGYTDVSLTVCRQPTRATLTQPETSAGNTNDMLETLACVDVLPQHFQKRTEENHKKVGMAETQIIADMRQCHSHSTPPLSHINDLITPM